MASKVLRYCFACIRSVPVVFITSLIGWSYYAYVVQLCIYSVSSMLQRFFYLVLFHPLFVMMLWSYWKSIFTDVAVPPKQFCLGRHDLDRLSRETNPTGRREVLSQIGRSLPILTRTLTGEIRYCDKCKSIRPDRAHHCSVCGRCVLKMDHHCPWINNCVNFSNYKFFFLFLGYALAYSLFAAVSSLPYFIKFWQRIGASGSNLNNLHIVFLFFAGTMFAISLMALFGYHMYLVSRNRSTIEAFQVPVLAETGPEKDAFNLGCYRNYREIFGTRRLYWFLPVFTSSGDGVTFAQKCDDEVRSRLLGRRQRWAEEGTGADSPGSDDESRFLATS